MQNKNIGYNNTSEAIKNKASDMQDSMSETIDKGKEKTGKAIKESTEELKNGLSDLQENMSNYVQNHPFISLGISALAGMILGELLKK